MLIDNIQNVRWWVWYLDGFVYRNGVPRNVALKYPDHTSIRVPRELWEIIDFMLQCNGHTFSSFARPYCEMGCGYLVPEALNALLENMRVNELLEAINREKTKREQSTTH